MGMFDYIRVEIEIPGCGDCSKEEFQTKSLDCDLLQYVITKNGELYVEEWDYEWIKDDTLLIGGYSEKKLNSYRRNYLTNYTGEIIFYGKQLDTKKWRDYYANFTEGKLTTIRYTDFKY